MAEALFRTGFVSIIGRPNVGKSTLLNRILGEKIVITSEKPQTTRNRVQGIHNLPGAQIVFIDTPGIHQGGSQLNRYMVQTALSAMRGVDLILLLVEADSSPREREKPVVKLLAEAEAPVILAINKIDRVRKERLLELIAAYSAMHPFLAIVPISAATGDGVAELVEVVRERLPEGNPYFPDDILTDLPERFIVAEMIREKVFRLIRDEVPYSTAVEVESFQERPGRDLVAVSASIIVERESQKGIVIGRKGEMLKRIGSMAREDIERLLGVRVFLELFVKVRRDWSGDNRMLKELGYE